MLQTSDKRERLMANISGDADNEGALRNATDQVKRATRDLAANLTKSGSAAYDHGSDLVARSPGSALLTAGIIGFALGVILTKGSQPPRNSLQQYYDRYTR
jgi:ElaB/YqjD/DUF883 family membrane-anchored ribosome-binding protein